MQGIEKSHCNTAIQAVLSAFHSFMSSTVEEALRPVNVNAYGKIDTLGLDAIPEINIVRSLREYDGHCVVISEEIGVENSFPADSTDPRRYRTIFFCDPTDRSRQVQEILTTISDKSQHVGDVFRTSEIQKVWEKKYGGTPAISGGSSAITCVRDRVPIFSVMVNYLTQQLFLSCGAGNFVIDISKDQSKAKAVTTDFIASHGKRIYFHDLNHSEVRRYVTFVSKQVYPDNLRDCRLMSEEEIERQREYDVPGGPLRILYLSTLQPEERHVGFILANGEKITEWIHWLPYVLFARKKSDDSAPALRLFEVFQDRPRTKDGILMAPPARYSVFTPFSKDDHRMIIDVSRFANFFPTDPSQFRATLIATPYDNNWMTGVMRQYGYRSIQLYQEAERVEK